MVLSTKPKVKLFVFPSFKIIFQKKISFFSNEREHTTVESCENDIELLMILQSSVAFEISHPHNQLNLQQVFQLGNSFLREMLKQYLCHGKIELSVTSLK